jgi:peptidoglycan/LPS O-acetylase OafA/YrhL
MVTVVHIVHFNVAIWKVVGFMGGTLALSVLMAWVTYLVIEKPMEQQKKLGPRLPERAAPEAPPPDLVEARRAA